jgi:hypothetical protein
MLKNKEEGGYAIDCSKKTKMIKRYALLVALMVSLIVLAQLIGGIGCLSRKAESDSPSATAREAVFAQIKWLEEQKFEEPAPPPPLGVNLDNVESDTHRIGRDSGDTYGYMGVNAGAGGGVGGDGGAGGGIGGGLGGGG